MTQPFVRPDVAAFLAMSAASGMPPLHLLPVEDARAGIGAMGAIADLPPTDIAVVKDLICPTPDGDIPLRFYDSEPNRTRPSPVILFFHGGGFVFGDLDGHDSFCRFLANNSALPLVAVDYRLAPEHPFPAFVDDAEYAARWLASSPAELGLSLTGIVTCGDSAGGHLAILVAQQLGLSPAALPVLAQWTIYPFVGGGTDWDSVRQFGEGYMVTRDAMDWFDGLCGDPYGDPRYSLLLGPIPSTPLLVQTAGLDPLRDQGMAYAELARTKGARVTHLDAEGMIHGFVNLRAALPSAVDDVKAMIAAGLTLLAD